MGDNNKKQIVPSIIAENQKELDERIAKVDGKVSAIQLDIMDGRFAPSKSLGFEFVLPKTKCNIEAHLMVEEPIEWIEEKGYLVDTIIFHIESTNKPSVVISKIERLGKKPGIAIGPRTKIHEIKKFIGIVKHFLIFTADKIGYYGAEFNKEAIDKVDILRKLNTEIDIEVDGGVNPDTIKELSKAGANLFVCGSFIQKSQDAGDAIKLLLDNAKQ